MRRFPAMAISTIGFEEFAAQLLRSQTSGIQFINGSSTLIDGVGFDSRIRVVGDEYRVAPPDGPVYGIPSSGHYFISNAESAETDDIILTTNRVLVESWFGRNEFYGFGGGASAVTVTAFGAYGDLDSVSVDLPDSLPDQADPPVRLDSLGFAAFAGQILGYRINRVAIGEFGGQWVADDFRFLDVEDALPPAAPQILQALDDQDPITGVLLSGATTNDTTPSLSGTADPGSLVELFADGGSLGSTLADGSGAWSFTPTPPLADGTRSFIATASNPAGIRGADSAPFQLTIDTVVPQVVRLTGPSSVLVGDSTTPYTVSLAAIEGGGLGAGRSVTFSLVSASGTAIQGVDFFPLEPYQIIGVTGVTLSGSESPDGVITITATNTSGAALVAGAPLATFSIMTTSDRMGRPAEEIYSVTINGGLYVAVEPPSSVWTTILNPPVSLRLSGPNSVLEGDLSELYSVALGSSEGLGIGRSVMFTLESASGTAAEGVDFTALVAGDLSGATGVTLSTSTGADGVVTVTATNSSGSDLAAGSALATFAIQTAGDALIEGEETYAVTIGGGADVLVEGAEMVTTSIGDDEEPPPLSLTGPTSVQLGDLTTPYTVSLGTFEGVSLGAGNSVTFTLVSLSGTAIEGINFFPLEAYQINASPGISLVKSTSWDRVITVTATNISGADLMAGAPLATFSMLTTDESAGFVANYIVKGGDAFTEGEPAVVTEIISPPIPLSLTGPASVAEGDLSAAYTVSLGSGVGLGVGRSVTFTLDTASGTAGEGVDFAALVAGNLTATVGLTLTTSTGTDGVVTVTATNSGESDLAAGSALLTFAIQTTEDGINEGEESFAVTIGGGAGVSVEGAVTQATAIGDDDPLAVTTPIRDVDPPASTTVIGDGDPPAVPTTDDQPAPAEAPLPTARVRSTVGTSGPDKIVGGVGDDRLEGLGGDDDLRGRNGYDQLFGGEGDDRQRGGRGKDVLMGDGGDDELSGGRGADRLIGGEGDDLLNGNKGKDLLIGSLGADRFFLSRGEDVIQDFSLVDPDLIVIPAGKTFSLAEDREGNVRIDCEGFGTATLLGVSLAAFQQVNPILLV